MKHFYDAKDVQQILGCGSIRTAQLRIQAMNEELKGKGYWVERGKIPISFFNEKYPYLGEKR
ncbi:hypothetical protein ACHHV8_25660 [Paenibacillus sp. TAB 01]|uniref:hypothetical protein n=1 Tax=Paenibacillus sp. TAB 01 TaxID=3368988 RepID=UPI003751C0B0